jgi:hypothetical protein
MFIILVHESPRKKAFLRRRLLFEWLLLISQNVSILQEVAPFPKKEVAGRQRA